MVVVHPHCLNKTTVTGGTFVWPCPESLAPTTLSLETYLGLASPVQGKNQVGT